MASQREIQKVGLALVEGDRILLVRKRGSRTYILPGGKPEAGEDDVKALVRELDEELGCQIDLGTDLTGLFWTKLCEKLSLGKELWLCRRRGLARSRS